jgi:hypothetical protein
MSPMTERKPPGVDFETWVDRQIREAKERGEFDDLPLRGKPLPGLDGPPDELWWVKQWLQRENVSVTPPALALRKAVQDLDERLAPERDEAAVRRIVEELNDRIREANRKPLDGPPSTSMPVDVEQVVDRWRERRAARSPAPAAPEPSPETAATAAPGARPRWWRRRRSLRA